MQATTLHPDIRITSDPISTPEKFRSGHCHLELTPVWQYVIKKNRFPANVDRQEVFSELAVRLQHPEWQVRLHGSRVLAYIVPAVGPQLDALMSPSILPSVITNLAHFSPALRSSSMDAILIYVQHSSDPEHVLKSMIIQGLDVSGAKSSLTVNVMECVPIVLQQIVKRNGDRPIAIPTFVHLVTALSNKMIQATFQQAAVYCLDRVKEIVGRNKFDHYLETFHPIIKKDFEVLCEVYRISSSSGRDSSISSYDDEDDVEISKTPRRVTFGGELIKIRSPEVSDDPTEMLRPTGIPIPIKPALNIPKHPKDELDNKSTRSLIPRQTEFRRTTRTGNYFYHKRTINQVRPNTLPPLRQSNFKQFSSAQIGPCIGTPFRRKVVDRISFNKGLFSPHAIICTGRTNGSFYRNYKNTKIMKMDESDTDFAKTSSFSPTRRQHSPSSHREDLRDIVPAADTGPPTKRNYRYHNSVLRYKFRNKNRCNRISLNHTMFVVPKNVPPSCTPAIINIESSIRTTLSMTVVPEIRPEQKLQSPAATDASTKEEHYDANRNQQQSSNSSNSNKSHIDILSESSSNIPLGKFGDAAILETRHFDQSRVSLDSNKSSANGLNNHNNNNVQFNSTNAIQTKNDKPVAQVKPTKSTVQKLQPSTERRRSVGRVHQKKQEKIPDEMGSNFTPFNEPQKALQLAATQINCPEWEAAVTGLQNISRLSMFHGKELRPNSLQPFVRTVAKHIKSLRSQVSRAACTAVQKMFTYVPKSVEPDVEVIASALFPRTADTNKFLRVQSADALNAMVDNVNPIKCVHVITSKGIKHGNRLVRAEACRLLARVVDKLGVGGTLHLPMDARNAVITAATNMVFDNTPTSRQAAQHILSKLSEDPRGAALISSAASPNVKVTLNKSLSRIFLK